MQNYFIQYTPDEEEALWLEKQKSCKHDKWHIRCSVCRKILGSEKHQAVKIAQINDNFESSYESPHNNIYTLYKGEQTPNIVSKGYGVIALSGDSSIFVTELGSSALKNGLLHKIPEGMSFIVKAQDDTKLIIVKI